MDFFITFLSYYLITAFIQYLSGIFPSQKKYVTILHAATVSITIIIWITCFSELILRDKCKPAMFKMLMSFIFEGRCVFVEKETWDCIAHEKLSVYFLRPLGIEEKTLRNLILIALYLFCIQISVIINHYEIAGFIDLLAKLALAYFVFTLLASLCSMFEQKFCPAITLKEYYFLRYLNIYTVPEVYICRILKTMKLFDQFRIGNDLYK
uniref:Uncharacterized protein n=1 Tax=Octopus bimaculoides TaxID=37653 RepID=A0A0L8HS05_OCTBM